MAIIVFDRLCISEISRFSSWFLLVLCEMVRKSNFFSSLDKVWISKLRIQTLSTCAVFLYSFFSRFHDFSHFLFFSCVGITKGFRVPWQANDTNAKHLIEWNGWEFVGTAHCWLLLHSMQSTFFANRIAYDQHRTKPFFIGTQCYALQRQNSEITAGRTPQKSKPLHCDSPIYIKIALRRRSASMMIC